MRARAVFALVVTLAAFLFFFHLGQRSFRNPDEGRYAEVAREMVMSGNWIEPRLYGVDYLRKPILFYWLIALSFKYFGFNEYAARLVPALFGVLGVAMTFLFARKTMGERAAVFSSLLLMTNFWFLQVGRYLLIDMVFSLFAVASLYSFYLASADAKKRGLYYALFYVSAGAAFLAKGVAGFVIPGMSVLLYMASKRNTWGFFRPDRLLLGAAAAGAIAAPWFILISLKEPEFLKFFFLHEHLQRFSSSDFEHQQAWFYYLWVLPAIFMPWSVLVPPLKKMPALVRGKADGGTLLFCALSAAGIVVFYSLSKTKLPTYLLPAVPLICLVLGRAWQTWCDEAPAGKDWPLVVPVAALIFVSIGFLATSAKVFAMVPERF
jgi:4-amino-4-deoxy-L-arabinose transferase-like glycosyltransferase